MPGKKYKSVGIREKLYNRIEEEKKEGESTSDYIDRVIDIATERKEEKKEGLTTEQIKNAVKEVLGERKEQGNVMSTDTNAGITKQDLIEIENEAVERIKAIVEGLLTH
jgi:negative regulator of replication initiation